MEGTFRAGQIGNANLREYFHSHWLLEPDSQSDVSIQVERIPDSPNVQVPRAVSLFRSSCNPRRDEFRDEDANYRDPTVFDLLMTQTIPGDDRPIIPSL